MNAQPSPVEWPIRDGALKWDAVDFEQGAVYVRLALSRRGLDREKYPNGWKLSVALSALRRWKAIQAEERLRLGAEYEN